MYMLGANLLESLFVLSFNHQNPQLGLIALTVTLLKLTPMGVIVHHLLSVFLTRTKKRKKKFRLFVRIAGVTEVVGGIVIFLLQLCLLLLAFKNYP
jgi:hypothetical protein